MKQLLLLSSGTVYVNRFDDRREQPKQVSTLVPQKRDIELQLLLTLPTGSNSKYD